MKDYYQILGISEKASFQEITAAKIELAKKYHPDSNIQNQTDTTAIMQEILEAYQVLSDEEKRKDYDASRKGRKRTINLYDLKKEEGNHMEGASFTRLWRAANRLNDLVEESKPLLRDRETHRVKKLAREAAKNALILKKAGIADKYWNLNAMNWMLFAWYQNQNLGVEGLIRSYEEFLKTKSVASRSKMLHQRQKYGRAVKKLICFTV